jgi:pSer/pThr/pTyr-binding forkhead associated (FHA) protein
MGSAQGCDVVLPGAEVAPIHAEMVHQGALTGQGQGPGIRHIGWRIKVDDSASDVLVNGEQLTPGSDRPVEHGDRLIVGGFDITVHLLSRRELEGSSPGLSGIELGQRLSKPDAPMGQALKPGRVAPAGVAGSSGGPGVLVVINGPARGRSAPVPESGRSLIIGRSSACDVTLPDPRVSRRHARLGRGRQKLWIRDLGGVGGVLVNGVPAKRQEALSVGDLVDIGGTRLEVRSSGASGAFERIAPGLGSRTTPEGLLGWSDEGWSAGRRLSQLWGQAQVELDRWEVSDPAGLLMGLSGVGVGIAGIILSL